MTSFRTVVKSIVEAPIRVASSLRGRSSPLVLYQFKDSNPHRPTSTQTWHIIGDERAVTKFINPKELRRLAPSVRRTGVDGQTTYVGVYKNRMVSRFRRVLRERGAELEIRYERPSLSETRRFYLHENWHGK